MAILTHLNKRIRGDSSVALPLTPLAKQFANPATAPMASNFCLVYLEMGLGRAAPAQRAVVVPPLLRGIARRGAAQQETLLSLLLGSLSELPLPGSHAELEGRLPFLTDPADRALVLEWLLDLLQFLPPPAAPAADRSAEPPPGLSADAAKRVKGRLSHEEVRGELLAAKKLAACRLLGAPAGGAPVPVASSDAPAVTAAGGPATAAGSPSAGGEGPLFSPLETLPHWLVASCDGDGAVKTTGEARLRAVAAGTDLESHALIDSLCSLVLGSEAAAGAAAGSAASPAARRRPSAVAVRTKAVSHLCRSVAAASRFPGVLQAAFHALFAGDATPRLQQQGAALAEHISSHAALPLLDAAGAHLLAGLLRVTRGEATPGLRPDAPEAVSMRSHAYGALAALCRRAPKLLAADSALPTELFGALRTEEAGARTPLHEALAALAKVHAPGAGGSALPAQTAARLTRLLAASAADRAPQARLAAMAWAATVFSRDDVPTRLVCLAGAADERPEVREAALAALRPVPPPAGGGSGGDEALAAGTRVAHEGSDGVRRLGVVAQVHADAGGGPPYYTVALEGAEGSLSERSTERGRLSSLSAGWPPFAEVVRAILGRVALTRLDHAAGGVWEVPLLDPGSAEAEGGEGPPPLPTQATGEALRYALDCLRAEAVALLPGEPPETAVGSRLAVMLRASDAAGGVPGVGAGARELMALLGRSLFAHHGDRELLAAAASSLHTLVTGAVDAASKAQVAEAAALGALPRRVAEAEEPLKNVALSSSFASDSTQRLLCEALAAGAKALPRARATALLRSVVGMLPSLDAGCSGPSEAKRAVGASLLAGFLTARLDPAASSVSADAMEVDSGSEAGDGPAALEAARTAAAAKLGALLKHRTPHVTVAAAAAVGAVGAAGPLPLPVGVGAAEAEEGGDAPDAAAKEGNGGQAAPKEGAEATSTATAATTEGDNDEAAGRSEEEMTKHSVVAHLASLLRREKVRTTAVRALGQLVAGDPHAPFRNAALLAILGMHTVKDVELQLVVGDALATLAMSPPRQASSAPPPALPRIKPPEAPAVTGTGADATLAERTADAATACELAAGDTLLRYVLGRVLLQHVVAWAPLERQAGAAWLLALLRQAAKSGGGELAVRTAAGRIQAALVGLLADSNEATQELASKGLSALFDCCDEASRATILQELVAGLQSSRAANASASGGEMATYKELSEIATSVGQPALVYKLMECAASSAVWNTRKGVAFALAEQSRDALEPHLPSLLPTLFRYTFDPNPRVANAMRQLWAALVPDPKPALTKHLQPVLEHLCASLGDRLWRGRESACLALAELLPGRTLAELSPTLARLLTALLRVLDDVKETVRKAAEPAWRAVSSACVRLSDGGRASASDAEAVLEIALPILLDGVLLPSEEARRTTAAATATATASPRVRHGWTAPA